jgi:hypothetical protein
MKLKRAKTMPILLAKKSMPVSLKAACLCSRSGKTTAARGGMKIHDATTLIIGGGLLAVNHQQLALTTNRKT